MRLIYFCLGLTLVLSAMATSRTQTLTDQLGGRTSGTFTFNAELISKADNNITMRNTATGEIFSVISSKQTTGDIAKAVISVNGTNLNLISWGKVESSGKPLGSISRRSGMFVEVSGNWYRLNSPETISLGDSIVGKLAYGNNDRTGQVFIIRVE